VIDSGGKTMAEKCGEQVAGKASGGTDQPSLSTGTSQLMPNRGDR